MRKFPLLAVAAIVLGATVVALASASRNASSVSWLPLSVTAAGNNWLSGEGDVSNSRFSTLKQINSSNVQNLHVVWNQQFNTPDIQFSPEGQPICCPNNQLILEGNARLCREKAGLESHIGGDKIILGMGNGRMEIRVDAGRGVIEP